MVNIIREICIFYALISIFCWIKPYGGCFRQVFCHLGKIMIAGYLDRWLSYIVMVLWEFVWLDSGLVVLDKWVY